MSMSYQIQIGPAVALNSLFTFQLFNKDIPQYDPNTGAPRDPRCVPYVRYTLKEGAFPLALLRTFEIPREEFSKAEKAVAFFAGEFPDTFAVIDENLIAVVATSGHASAGYETTAKFPATTTSELGDATGRLFDFCGLNSEGVVAALYVSC